mmetsp:Transcript_57676/g.137499  ORF Transcript_57676/g.137499 Transcript_57676/m.137499 type:complete len:128 (-) Transcript_57676:184-567(-)
MPWRDLVFPSEGGIMVFPSQCMMHPLAGPSFNSLARPSHGEEEVKHSQEPRATNTISNWLDALNSESGEDAGGLAYRVAEEPIEFQRHKRPTGPPSGWLDELNSESEDAGGLDARISNAAASGEEEA